MTIDDYEYGTLEKFEFISEHIEGDINYVRKGMRLNRTEDREFAMACVDYFHPSSPAYRTTKALYRCFDLLPNTQGQWRQGLSTHHLAIWPENPDPKKTVIDGYWGEDAVQVGDFKHGSYTWFCIMAQAAIQKLKESKSRRYRVVLDIVSDEPIKDMTSHDWQAALEAFIGDVEVLDVEWSEQRESI